MAAFPDHHVRKTNCQPPILAEINPRTVQRWRKNNGQGDRRPDAIRPAPAHALTDEERTRIVAVANEARFAETPPARIVPVLADESTYIASESSFHRVLRAHGQMNRRGRARPPRRSRPPTTHIATGPGEVWCWDATFPPATVKGQWYYLYLILDLYSRKIVGFEVHATDSAHHAAHLARRTALTEDIHAMAARPVLHGDNGATLKATTVLAMLHWLGIEPSCSRPRVSVDNPYAEALFRTAKYRPEFPAKGLPDLDAARDWVSRFVHWYNNEHRHSGIKYVTPTQRHAGQDRSLLTARHEHYEQARRSNPRRWSRQTRDRAPAAAVTCFRLRCASRKIPVAPARRIADARHRDGAAPAIFDPLFFKAIAIAGVIDPFRRLDGRVLIALDGTECFASRKIHCPRCSKRK